ncbi:MAG: hypothetical protein ACRDTT_25320 [Pseudonocardiaceae bacterium]
MFSWSTRSPALSDRVGCRRLTRPGSHKRWAICRWQWPQVAAYLNETGLSADAYLRLLDTQAAELLAEEAPTGYPMSLAPAG